MRSHKILSPGTNELNLLPLTWQPAADICFPRKSWSCLALHLSAPPGEGTENQHLTCWNVSWYIFAKCTWKRTFFFFWMCMIHYLDGLTHLPRDKMATIFADDNFKCIFLNENFTKICSQESNWQWTGIGSGNGLAPTRWQAITRTNADPVHWRIYVALGGRRVNAKEA